MTKRHQKIVTRLLEAHRRKPGTVAIALFGSLAKGTCRDTSDIDFEVIASDADEWTLEKNEVDGIVVDLVRCPLAHFEQQVAAFPYLSFDYLSMKVLWDPSSIMRDAQINLRGYFEAHRHIAEYWEENLKTMTEKKRAGTHRMADIVEAYDRAERLFSQDGVIRRSFLRG